MATQVRAEDESGGTGVTFVLSHFLALLQSARSGRSPIRLLHLVWHVRHGSDVTWIAPLLNQAAKEHPDIDVRVEVFVTRTKVADEPWPGEVQTPGVETPPTVTSHGDHLSGRSSQTTLVDPAESRPLLETIPTPTTGLSRSAQEIVSFKPGRADLCTILRRDVARSEGQVNVTVCGPEALMSSARTAVREVNTPEAARRGQVEVEFFEETVGS
jgi:ferric-chelate reductase